MSDGTIGDAITAAFAALLQIDEEKSGAGRQRVLPETSPERVRELRRMKYPDFLETPEWKETALRVKWKWDRLCFSCGSAGTLHVHHLTYDRRGAELWDDVVPLCAKCHMTYHALTPDR